MKNTFVCVLFLSLVSVPLPASSQGVRLPAEFSRARLITSSGKPLNASAVSVRADSLVCTVHQGARESRQTMSIADVRYLEVTRGSSAARYGWIGVLIGSVSSIGAIAQQNASPSPGYGLDPIRIGAGQAVGITVGFAAAGGLIGALIGSSHQSYVPIRRGNAWLHGVEVSYCPPTSMPRVQAVAVRISF